MEKLQQKANILIEALPYMQKFYGKTIVIKYGGNAMIDDELKFHFAQDVVLLKQVGINPIIVHGGGPQIGSMLGKLNIESKFIDGYRVTNDDTMDVVEMVLSGKVNKDIVGLIAKVGGRAVGISGRDGHLITAKKLVIPTGELNRVGIVTDVDTKVLNSLKDFIPVIAPVGIDENGEPLNINADLVAGSIAAAMKAEKLLMLTDVPGLLNKDKKCISTVTLSEIEEFKKDGTITGGMIPKLKSAYDALESGVSKVHIVDGRIKHSVILELFTNAGIGTEIINA